MKDWKDICEKLREENSRAKDSRHLFLEQYECRNLEGCFFILENPRNKSWFENMWINKF